MDVGTGGGFPGLPLAVQYPDAQFVLADSVGKKIDAVADMAHQLNLQNVQTHHGRVEDYLAQQTALASSGNDSSNNPQKFDVVTGRSVTALPQFCAWIQDLLEDDGHLVYWTGGTVDATLLAQAIQNTSIQDQIPDWWSDNHDKRILVFPAAAVREIAAASGIVVKPTGAVNHKPQSKRQQERKTKKAAKGAWSNRRKNPNEPRQRGYENFRRYSSSSSSNTVGSTSTARGSSDASSSSSLDGAVNEEGS